MDFDLLEKLGKIAGIGGIAVGVVFLIFWSIIQKRIFPELDKAHSYNLLRMLVIGSFVVAIAGLMAWVYTNQQQPTDPTNPMVTVRIEGSVVGQENQPLEGVLVEIDGYESTSDITDQSGKYTLSVKGRKEQSLDLLFKRNHYKRARKEINVNFNSNEKFEVESVKLKPKEEEAVEEAVEEKSSHSKASKRQSKKGNITLVYSGDSYGCVLDITINVGGQSVQPQANIVQLSNVDLGLQGFAITGIINCGTYGYCQSNGNGTLNLEDNGKYYVMWKPADATGVCQIGLYDQATFESTPTY